MDRIGDFLRDVDERRVGGLPIGYRFRPTGLQLLDHYLIPKLKGEEVPSNQFILDLDVCQCDPDDIPLNQFKLLRENEGYFFTREERENSLEGRQIRATPNGYWEIFKENIPIYRAGEIIGFKNKLFYYTGKSPNGNKTDWKVTQYRCNSSTISSNSMDMNNMENCMVCRVRLKVRMEEEEENLVEGSSGEENGLNEGHAEAKTM